MFKPSEQARLLLENITPLRYDCGSLCESACCACDEDDQGGVWLLEDEIELLKNASWAEIHMSETGEPPLLLCKGPCERSLRPFFCRIFPLLPVCKKGEWTVRMDRRARSVCPLAQSGINGLDPAFVEAAKKSVSLLAQDASCEKILHKWAALERRWAQDLEAFL